MLIILCSCYTQLSLKNNTSDNYVEIPDANTFLPIQTFTTEDFSITKLYGKWINSREEENNIIKIYRPKDYKEFPPSRFRDKINFYGNGKCEFLVLEPNDGQKYLIFRWRLLKENPNIVYLFKDNGKMFKSLRIEKLDRDILKFIWIF